MYRLNPEEQAVVDKASEICQDDIRVHAERVDREAVFPSESIRALAEAGLLGLTISRDHGGMGHRLRVACAVLDEIAQYCGSTAMVYVMHLCGVACYSVNDETQEAMATHLAAAARGEHLSTLAWSEKGSRSHFWAPVSQEETADDGTVRITAEKSWVTSAGHASGYVVSTRRAGTEKDMQTTLYLVLRDDRGLSVAGPWESLGMRGNASAPMRLEGVRLPPERALTKPGAGMDVMLQVVLPIFQLGNAAISVGLCEAAVRSAQRHLTGKRFEHLDSKLADLPNLRSRLAQMRIETDRARAHLLSVIDSLEAPGAATQLLVLEAKAAAAETANRVTDLGMLACGGAAYSRHLTLERNFRDARASAVMAPTNDVIHDMIGRALCGMELFS